MAAKTEFGENMIVDARYDDDGEVVWKISTMQDNDWLRINRYDKNGTVEEAYEK